MDAHELAAGLLCLWRQDEGQGPNDPANGFYGIGLAYQQVQRDLAAHTAAAVEAERAACEAIVRFDRRSDGAKSVGYQPEFHRALQMVGDAIAARKAPE